jgi:hypothetical protein
MPQLIAPHAPWALATESVIEILLAAQIAPSFSAATGLSPLLSTVVVTFVITYIWNYYISMQYPVASAV